MTPELFSRLMAVLPRREQIYAPFRTPFAAKGQVHGKLPTPFGSEASSETSQCEASGYVSPRGGVHCKITRVN